MNTILKKTFKSSLVNSILLVILGLLLIFESQATIISISYIVGGVIIAFGLVAILRYVKEFNEITRNELDLIYGVICLILGVVVIRNPKAIASIIPFVVGAIIILNSATKLQYSIELKKEDNKLWKSTMIIALITTICGIVLIFNPFGGAVLITKTVGILILIYGILDIISSLSIKYTINEYTTDIEKIEDNVKEAEVVDIDEEPKSNKKKKTKKKKTNNKAKKEDSKKGDE